MTSEKKPRELWVNPARLNDWMDPNTGLYAASDCPKPGHLHFREVIEPDERDARIKDLEWFIEQVNAHVCPGVADTKDAALITLRKRDAEIAKLKETLNVAKECLAHLSNLDTINQGNPMEGVAFKSLARIRAILGEKEGGE